MAQRELQNSLFSGEREKRFRKKIKSCYAPILIGYWDMSPPPSPPLKFLIEKHIKIYLHSQIYFGILRFMSNPSINPVNPMKRLGSPIGNPVAKKAI